MTPSMLEQTLRSLGVRAGGIVLVHSSLARLGYVVHGVEALRAALDSVLGPEGTVLVPTFTGESTDPSCWVDPALPAALWSEVRDSMQPYDPARSLPRSMGSFSMAVLLDPERVRSNHPLVSFAALGPRAEELCSGHDLRDPFGPDSPLGRARTLGAQVLLVGVDQRRNSALLHAHCLADVPAVRRDKGAFLVELDGERRWVTPERLSECSEGFGRIEDDLVARGLVRVARAGDGTCRLMDMSAVVGFVEHMLRSRPHLVWCGRPECRQCG